MTDAARVAHPYIPNSASIVRAEMLAVIGVKDVAELYASVPSALRVEGMLDLPAALEDEVALRRHMGALLGSSRSVADQLSFLGAGCYLSLIHI